MKIHVCLKAALVGSVFLASSSAWGQEEPAVIEVAGPLAYVRIFADSGGESHFDDREFSFKLVDFAPPAPPISVSEAMAAEHVMVISSPRAGTVTITRLRAGS